MPFSDAQTFEIIGAGMDVHRELGCGFHERAYRHPFKIELSARDVPHRDEMKFPVIYKGRPTPIYYRVDFACFGTVLVELKALASIGPLEHSQMINYLKASKFERGLILNFGARSFQFKRVICGLANDPLQQ